MLIKQIYLNTHMGISISSINYAFNHVNAFEIHDGSLGLEQNRQYRHGREQVVSLAQGCSFLSMDTEEQGIVPHAD